MSRLNEIKKIRYKLRNTDSLELSKKDIEFLCDWAEKGIVAISKTETVGYGWRKKDKEELMEEYDLSDADASDICKKLEEYEEA